MSYNNIPQKISSLIGRQLHNQKNHPIEILKTHIYKYFGNEYQIYDNFDPKVTIEDNFDLLLIPENHVARSPSDTYYFDKKHVLRTHTSAHQNYLLSKGITKFLVSGDVYRKDEIDRSHYPVFHQMEGVCIVGKDEDPEIELKKILCGLVEYLFPNRNYELKDDYFPFTNPSFEINVEFGDKWLEILGCGVVQPKILENCRLTNEKAFAFGLGLERLAMILFEINDIRLFWSTDNKFLDQFSNGEIVKFKPYGNLESIKRDISFWIKPEETIEVKNKDSGLIEKNWIVMNDWYEFIRGKAGDIIEQIQIMDTFTHPKNNKFSIMVRLTYSSVDPNIKDGGEFKIIIDNIHGQILATMEDNFMIQLR